MFRCIDLTVTNVSLLASLKYYIKAPLMEDCRQQVREISVDVPHEK